MPVSISFHGAARTVTGSCFRLETSGGQILIDCGLFQGSKTEKELNYRPFPFKPRDIAAVVLSHAHIDHSGLLPKLVKRGFRGPIFATAATADLAGVMLPDSAYIQEIEVKNLNKRKIRRGDEPVSPIYVGADVPPCLKQFQAVGYESWFEVVPGVRARLWNAGHLLGSASVELQLDDEDSDTPIRVLFSADIGPNFKLLQPDPVGPHDLDFIICEGTYGDVDRAGVTEDRRRQILRDEVVAAHRPSGVLLIPSFAVERTQELISDLHRLMTAGEIPHFPIYIDSPLATRATGVFSEHASELEGGREFIRGIASRNVRFTESVEQSKALDRLHDFHIVIAASGMCEAGRIRYRLKNWLWRDEATVLLVGFQAQGTLGRILQDGASTVRIQGEEIKVRARIRSIDLYSGHADGPELAEWVRDRLPVQQNIFLVHGEEDALSALQERLVAMTAPDKVVIPEIDETYLLSTAGARRAEQREPARIAPQSVAHLDWHNDVSKLFLDINEALESVADERARNVLIRRLRRALEEGG